jgi:hypothetical protein
MPDKAKQSESVRPGAAPGYKQPCIAAAVLVLTMGRSRLPQPDRRGSDATSDAFACWSGSRRFAKQSSASGRYL